MIQFVEIIARMTPDGTPKPLQLIWDDGRSFDIDAILDIRKKASTKGGGAGLRYTVKIKGKERFLFLNEDKWFIELD